LKGMLPKLKSSKYILVYRSSLGTFWYTLVPIDDRIRRYSDLHSSLHGYVTTSDVMYG